MAYKFFFKKGKIKLPKKIYIETSALLAAFYSNSPFHENAADMIRDAFFAKSKMFLSPLCLGEAWWFVITTFFNIDVKKKGLCNEPCHIYIKMHPEFLKKCKPSLNKLKKFIDEKISKGLFEIIDIPRSTVDAAYDNIFTTQLAPMDSLHYAAASCNDIDSIATADSDFDRIPNDKNFFVYSVDTEKTNNR